MSSCPQCQEVVSPEDSFCGECGERLQDYFECCQTCGRMFHATERFCSVDGTPRVGLPTNTTTYANPTHSFSQMHNWECPQCTFVNDIFMPKCEMCNTEKIPFAKIVDETSANVHQQQQPTMSCPQCQEVVVDPEDSFCGECGVGLPTIGTTSSSLSSAATYQPVISQGTSGAAVSRNQSTETTTSTKTLVFSAKQYSLKEIVEFKRDGRLDALGLDETELEHFLTDEAFEEAFQRSRSEFNDLIPWIKMGLKKRANLF